MNNFGLDEVISKESEEEILRVEIRTVHTRFPISRRKKFELIAHLSIKLNADGQRKSAQQSGNFWISGG